MQFSIYFTLQLAALVSAHVNHATDSEGVKASKRQLGINARSGLSKCSEKLFFNGVYSRAAARRQATAERHNKRLRVRDTETVLNTSHHSNKSVSPSSPETTIFNNSQACVLSPEVTEGPYYVPGEYIRSNVRENQTGIPIVLEAQFLNVETCEPIEGLWWDLWNCNATGVYSGVVEQGNGNTADASNINKTFLRGLAQSDSDGVVTFESIFPGHYLGRATHHHIAAHLNATVLANGTISGGTVAHVGQAFWDQDLIYKVEDTYPYNTNEADFTTNAEDGIFQSETANSTADAIWEYVYLGDKLEDGIFGWMTIALNISAAYDPSYSFAYTSSGGIAESGGTSSGGGPTGGNGAAPGNGTAPPGSMSSSSLMPRAFAVDWR